jgi:hypothetical protein
LKDARDISDQGVHREVAARALVDMAVVETFMADGRARAALSSDYKDAAAAAVDGFPRLGPIRAFDRRDGAARRHYQIGQSESAPSAC